MRKQLFDQLRSKLQKIALERAARASVRFEGSIRVFKNWAIFTGISVDRNGNELHYPPLENNDVAALWLRGKDGWQLVDYSAGHSDAFFVNWPLQYGIPQELVSTP